MPSKSLASGALYGKFSGDVRLLSEQMSTINKRVTVVETKVDAVIEAVDDLKVKSIGLSDRVRRTETRISSPMPK
jgi:hypothetical protein